MRKESFGLSEAEQNDLAAFYETTRDRTAAMICRLLGVSFAEHRALAEDLTQEVWLKVIRYKSRFIGQPEELRWGSLVMMIHNVVSNYRRHASKIRFTSYEDDDGEPPPDGEEETGPEGVLLREERAEAVRRAVDALPSPAREIVIERYYFERSYAEIGAMFGIKRATVGTILHRSLEKIGKEIGEDGKENE
ncbi:MAG: RNA polymerase sigma factor [Clostridiales bacterium]|nr:RNA polymerase sigma factor [Clostridiales bacterium]